MTSRLKRKLNNLGVDTSSRKANVNFCLIGTPLPPLEKFDTGEFVPLWKQEVRDEKGRRRLHGAFTGGWSAGYFNTVGSKEGWTPSTFVSSRTDRAKKQAPRPEDFMDDEDLLDLKYSRKLVEIADGDLEISLDRLGDVPVLSVQRKDNTHGLGYVPGPALNSAFSPGLNDEKSRSPSPLLVSKHPSYFRDGKEVLQGFVISDEPVSQDEWLRGIEKSFSELAQFAAASGEGEGKDLGRMKERKEVAEEPMGSVREKNFSGLAQFTKFQAASGEGDGKDLGRMEERKEVAEEQMESVRAQNFSGLAQFIKFQAASGEGEGKDLGRMEETKEITEEKMDSKTSAARLGMYGPLTREVTAWIPSRLLCKRFGVREPDVAAGVDPRNEIKKTNTSESPFGSFSSATGPAGAVSDGSNLTRPGGPRDITNIGLGEDETQGRDILTYERPPIDVFKAIFASDDEDEKEDETNEIQDEKLGNDSATDTYKPKFVSRPREETVLGKEGEKEEKYKGDRKARKKKKDKREKGRVLVSFEMEDGEEDNRSWRPSKKKRIETEKSSGSEENRDAMLVDEVSGEKQVLTPALPASRGRKLAADFIE